MLFMVHKNYVHKATFKLSKNNICDEAIVKIKNFREKNMYTDQPLKLGKSSIFLAFKFNKLLKNKTQLTSN